MKPGFSSTISVSSNEGGFSIDEQSTTSIGLGDGDRSIEGATLDLLVLRDVLFDVVRNGVPDVNETIMGTDPQNPTSFSLEPAVIDVAVLYSSLAGDYYGTKITNRIEHLLTATNQFYRNNDVGITLRVVAMDEVEYSDSDASLNETFNKFSAQSHEAFFELESIRIVAVPSYYSSYMRWTTRQVRSFVGSARAMANHCRVIWIEILSRVAC